ncbi:phospholipid/cholesterol/gamma-HCH transport system permease protein [Prosthecobacter debontii]|uniref:Phospholipid/cholesterol/gamma-HCH transport system permease protein n=1 Tax=Prosthecobacter debontii TaxID=48467 RepID=A0A1T4Z1R5_9BACT|nr:ABC transporter permease [Prosthecobacter debontii]SKB07974.1 phospholipid/cholesterol/gamma-HCH transport system permease protein [Prosthecobacter debontii]
MIAAVTSPSASQTPTAIWTQAGGSVILKLSGEWKRGGPAVTVEGQVPEKPADRYETEGLEEFDSTLPAFLLAHLRAAPPGEGETASLEGLPENLRGLMELALAVPERSEAKTRSGQSSDLRELGKLTLRIWAGMKAMAEFVGESVLSVGRFFTGRARFRQQDFWMTLQECGIEALPIVSLISFLIGLILAFVGNVQLTNFGANIFVADLVGIAMVREMGVVMTGIIMSGRTGAAFAAHLGSMKANEEIDALRTFGLNPFDFLVLPRLLALLLMLPILTIYSNIIGILGGMLVGAMVGIPPVLYWNETVAAIDLTTSSLGVFKSFFFAAAIAISGCMQGMMAGNSSAAVGQATTRAVVASITAIIILDSAFAAIFTVLDI